MLKLKKKISIMYVFVFCLTLIFNSVSVSSATSDISVLAVVGDVGNMVDGINVEIPVKITLTNTFDTSKDVNVNITVATETGTFLYSDNLEETISKNSSKDVQTVIPGVNKYGFYNLNLSITDVDTGKDFASDSFRFSVAHFPEEGVVNSEVGIINHVRHSGINDPLVNLDILKKAGFSNTRSEITWAAYESAKGQYALTNKYKTVMEKNAELGLGHLEILGYGNTVYGNDTPPSTDTSITAYANYGVELAGDLREILGADNLEVEIWNEYNNSPTFNKDGQPASTYAKMLKATYPKLKNEYPDMQIWAMSTLGVGVDWSNSWIPNVLSNLGSASKAKYFDGVSVHPYSNKVAPEKSDIFDDVEWLKYYLERYGYGDVPIRATEWGWPADGVEYVTEEEQASYFVRANILNDYHDAFSHIDWYNLSDQTASGEAGATFGIIGHYQDKIPYGAKPAFLTAANYNALMTDAAYIDSVLIGTDVRAYRYKLRDGRDCVVAWKISDGTEVASVNLGTNSVTKIDSYGNEAEVATVNNEITVKFDIMPVYLVGEFSEFAKGTSAIKDNGTVVEYDSETRLVSVYGKFNSANTSDMLNIMAIPESDNAENPDFSKMLYIGEVTAHNGIFSTNFSVAENTYGKYKLLLSFPNGKVPHSFDVGYVAEGEYNVVCTFEINEDESNIMASSYLQNESDTEQTVTMFISQYDEDGRLLSANMIPVKLEAGTKPALYTVSDVKNPKAVKYRAYMWDGITGIKPIIPYIER